MAEGVTPVPEERAPAERKATLDPPKPAYGFRFGIAYIFLAIVVGVAVGLAIVLWGRSGTGEGPPWAQWEPRTEGGTRIQEIANHVARRYRLENRQPLVTVYARSPTTESGDVRAIAVSAPVVRNEEDVELFPMTKSLMFNLCGGGQSCEIVAGEPTDARGALLRREALELALYTFKYVDDVESVVAFMPPRPNAEERFALFFHRTEFDEFLERPLAATLAQTPHVVVGDRPPDLPLVDELTLERYFRSTVRETQDGSRILLLDPAVLGTY